MRKESESAQIIAKMRSERLILSLPRFKCRVLTIKVIALCDIIYVLSVIDLIVIWCGNIFYYKVIILFRHGDVLFVGFDIKIEVYVVRILVMMFYSLLGSFNEFDEAVFFVECFLRFLLIRGVNSLNK